MEVVRGWGRGSYIYGQSVHNIRIERLWVDWTNGVGKKWSDFFHELEISYGLCVDNTAHLWLLHHLFLRAINQDAVEWAEAWNSHKVTMEDQKKQSPREMYTFGLYEQGPRGIDHLLQPAAEGIADLAVYGVDWQAQATPALVAHHAENNAAEWNAENPFGLHSTPEHMSEVVVEPPNCPFSPEQCAALDADLALVINVRSRDMAVRKQVWQQGLIICRHFYDS
ncbi:hypothetical protein B0H11DRAFT_1766872 [Mycena galericulata]|nr:hypothetical protein B0H11DRAFT_1766872 [Mycena galericulata]